MQDILILTGTCGVGKSTISRAWAERRLGATIDCDVFSEWIRNPALITADGFQEMLLARNAATLAEDYMALGMDVAINNPFMPAGVTYLHDRLDAGARVRVVWLNSAPAVNHARDLGRAVDNVMGDRVDTLQAELDAKDWPDYVIRLDTTRQSVEETVEAIEEIFGRQAAALPSGLTLRDSTPDDVDLINGVQCITIADYARATWGELSDAEIERACRDNVRIGQDRIVVLSRREIGVLSVEHREDEVFVDKLLILPNYQRWGIGTYLMRAVLDDAFRQGLPVKLHVLKVNPARRLYERLGFVEVEETNAYYVMGAMPGNH